MAVSSQDCTPAESGDQTPPKTNADALTPSTWQSLVTYKWTKDTWFRKFVICHYFFLSFLVLTNIRCHEYDRLLLSLLLLLFIDILFLFCFFLSTNRPLSNIKTDWVHLTCDVSHVLITSFQDTVRQQGGITQPLPLEGLQNQARLVVSCWLCYF